MEIANVYRHTLSDGSEVFAVQIWDSAKGGAKKLATLDCESEITARDLEHLINGCVVSVE